MTEKTFALTLIPVQQEALVASIQKMIFNPDACFGAHGVTPEEVLELMAHALRVADIDGGTTWELTAREVLVLHCMVASGDLYGIHDGFPSLEGDIYNLKMRTGFTGSYPGVVVEII